MITVDAILLSALGFALAALAAVIRAACTGASQVIDARTRRRLADAQTRLLDRLPDRLAARLLTPANEDNDIIARIR